MPHAATYQYFPYGMHNGFAIVGCAYMRRDIWRMADRAVGCVHAALVQVAAN